MNLAQMLPDHGSAPTSEKHPRSMHNFIRIWSYSSTNLQLRHQLVAQSTLMCHLSLLSVAEKKNPMPTVSQLPLTLKRQSYMEEINWARIYTLTYDSLGNEKCSLNSEYLNISETQLSSVLTVFSHTSPSDSYFDLSTQDKQSLKCSTV